MVPSRVIPVFFLSFFLGGKELCTAFTLKSNFWIYKGHSIGYEVAFNKDAVEVEESSTHLQFTSSSSHDDPILLLNGFGVGSFHQHRLFPHLVSPSASSTSEIDKNSPARLVYGIDYLGQGRSWPIACEDGDAECERGLIYSADTWIDQVIAFIEEVIIPNHRKKEGDNEPVKIHLAGNSVGGYLSVKIALKRPDLINSISLLNATPVWGLNLPGWSGHLPAPFVPKKIGRYLFDRIRDLDTIEKYLETAYSNRSAFGEDLMKQIRACTEGPGGHAAFASILWSPPASIEGVTEPDFNSKLKRLQCDVLLLFGKDDPWCKPTFAKKMLTSLNERTASVHRYVELSNAGHCPNHEAPQAVAHALNRWLSTKDRDHGSLTLVDTEHQHKGNIVHEPWGQIEMREVGLEEAKKLSIFDELTVKMVG